MTDNAGMGVSIEINVSISTENVWKALELKVLSPQDFLPVANVVTRPSDDGKGTYREMTTTWFAAQGQPESTIIENIYCLRDDLEVVFVDVKSDKEVVNKIIVGSDGTRYLEFFIRNKDTKERLHWEAPREIALKGVKGTLDKASSMDQTVLEKV